MTRKKKTLYFDAGNSHEGMKWTLRDQSNGIPIDLTGATVDVLVKSMDEETTIIDRSATITDATGGECELIPTAAEMSDSGEYKVQLKITFSDTTVTYIGDMNIIIRDVLS